MNNKKLLNSEIVVYFKQEMEEKLKSKCNLIIKNLHEDISSKQLENECLKIGPVVSCYIKK